MERRQFVKEVANKMRKNMCDLFIGSGISAPSGFPTWKKFLLPYLESIGITLKEEEDLRLLAQYIVNKNMGNRNIISDAIFNTFAEEYPLNKYHNIISRFPVRTVWTTNYDNLLERTFSDRNPRVVSLEDSLVHPYNDTGLNIIKLHGCAKTAAKDIVLTKEDYDCFQFNKPKFAQRLREAIINKSILFLGYNYQDPNIQLIMTQAYHMMNEITNSHFILMCEITKEDGENDESFNQRKVRFDLWISELNRLGIRELVVTKSEYASVLLEIDRKAHESCIFVTGSHATASPEVEKRAQNIGRFLAEKDEVILNNGQSTGIGSIVLSSFMQHIIQNKEDMNKRIKIFPNPYIASPDYEDDPNLIPDLKSVRLSLVTNSEFIFFFFGGIGTIAEIEVARSKGRIVLPIICEKNDYDNPAIKRILDDESNVEMLKELVTNYMEIIEKREVPEDEDVKKAIQEIIDGKI